MESLIYRNTMLDAYDSFEFAVDFASQPVIIRFQTSTTLKNCSNGHRGEEREVKLPGLPIHQAETGVRHGSPVVRAPRIRRSSALLAYHSPARRSAHSRLYARWDLWRNEEHTFG